MNLKRLALVLAFVTPFTSKAANLAQEINYVRAFLPAGQDIAQLQFQLMNKATPQEAMEAAKSNYVLRDITGDGIKDLLVISEPKPVYRNTVTGALCQSEEEDSHCYREFGRRELHFFIGDAKGRLHWSFTNDRMVLAADEGGVYGDPLQGFFVRKSGAIALKVFGGSAQKWGFTDVMQYRQGELKVIGFDDLQINGVTGTMQEISTNYITGEVDEKFQEFDEGPVKEKHYRVAVKPLQLVRHYRAN